jgi:rhamnulokinase
MVFRMSSSGYLAFDLGAGSGRAVHGRLDRERLQIREIHRFPNTPLEKRGHIHWDVFRTFDEMKRAMRVCAEDGSLPVSSLGIDTWGVDFGLLAEDGSLLGLPFCYRDKRTEGAMEDYFRLVPRDILYEKTGIQFLPFNSLFQIYAMVRSRSPLLGTASDLLFMPDLFNYLFAGKKATEPTIASTSQLLDPRTKMWIPGLFQAMGYSRKILPDIIPSGTVLGPLSRDIAEETGLRNSSVVATAGHDTAAAVAAVPAEGDGWAYISSGTWSLVGIELPEPVISSHSLSGNFTNEAGIGGKIRFLKNVTGLWLLQRCRESWGGENAPSYEELDRLAEASIPFPFFVDPDSPEFMNPPDMPQAIAAFCRRTGQRVPEGIGPTVRGILESLAFKSRFVLEQMTRVTGRPIERIHLIGGGTKNRLLGRFTASAAGIPVISGPVEAAAIGNLLCQAMALGHIDDLETLRSIVRNSFACRLHEPAANSSWNTAYADFLEIMAMSPKRPA